MGWWKGTIMSVIPNAQAISVAISQEVRASKRISGAKGKTIEKLLESGVDATEEMATPARTARRGQNFDLFV